MKTVLFGLLFFLASRYTSAPWGDGCPMLLGLFLGFRSPGLKVSVLALPFFLGLSLLFGPPATIPIQNSAYSESGVLVLASQVLTSSDRIFWEAILLILCLCLGHWLQNRRSGPKLVALLFLMGASYSLWSFPRTLSPIVAVTAQEPVDYQYHFDGALELKILHLINRGVPYYEAVDYGIEHDARNLRKFREHINIGLPLPVMAMARLLQWGGAEGFHQTLFVLNLAALVAHYLLLRRWLPEPESALATTWLVPLWIYLRSTWWVLFLDTWSLPFVFISMGCLAYRRYPLALIAGALAFLVRPIQIGYFASAVLVSFVLAPRKQKVICAILLTLLAFPIFGLYWSHQSYLTSQRGTATGRSFLASHLKADPREFWVSLRFGYVLMPWGREWVILAMASCGFFCWRRRRDREGRLWALLLSGPMVCCFLLARPGSEYNGWLVSPLLVALSPLALSRSAMNEEPQETGDVP